MRRGFPHKIEQKLTKTTRSQSERPAARQHDIGAAASGRGGGGLGLMAELMQRGFDPKAARANLNKKAGKPLVVSNHPVPTRLPRSLARRRVSQRVIHCFRMTTMTMITKPRQTTPNRNKTLIKKRCCYASYEHL
jgi:hypothetical protein